MQMSPREFDDMKKKIETAYETGKAFGRSERRTEQDSSIWASWKACKDAIELTEKLIAEHRGKLLSRNPGAHANPPVVSETDMETERFLVTVGQALRGEIK